MGICLIINARGGGKRDKMKKMLAAASHNPTLKRIVDAHHKKELEDKVVASGDGVGGEWVRDRFLEWHKMETTEADKQFMEMMKFVDDEVVKMYDPIKKAPEPGDISGALVKREGGEL